MRLAGTILLIAFLISCSEKEFIYGVNEVEVIPPNSVKQKQKTEQQYISILYANLFQEALSSNRLVEAERLVESIGDKLLAYELLVSSYMNDPSVILPGNLDMRADLDRFITDTYKRFYVREPTELEKEFFKNYIEINPDITVEQVYFAFSISDEYLFY